MLRGLIRVNTRLYPESLWGALTTKRALHAAFWIKAFNLTKGLEKAEKFGCGSGQRVKSQHPLGFLSCLFANDFPLARHLFTARLNPLGTKVLIFVL